MIMECIPVTFSQINSFHTCQLERFFWLTYMGLYLKKKDQTAIQWCTGMHGKMRKPRGDVIKEWLFREETPTRGKNSVLFFYSNTCLRQHRNFTPMHYLYKSARGNKINMEDTFPTEATIIYPVTQTLP
jgi:hypothetical protein